ncbi:MAG: citrate/2-methylcitrate synthase [Stellaceae bacterium]|jgi:citrate synthase
MTSRDGYLNATEAARALGITRATLYAYVSRGLIRSERSQGRSRRYHESDVALLKRGGESAARPDVETAITLALEGKLYYRGRDAAELARTVSVREAAALLWQADPVASFAADNLPDPLENQAALLDALSPLPPAARARALLQAAAAEHPASGDTAAFFGYAGARLLRFLAASVAGISPSARPVEAVLAEAWNLGRDHRPLLRAALILAADGGIDAASQAARLACSSGVPPWQSVGCGLAALHLGGTPPLFAGADPRGGLLLAMLGAGAGSAGATFEAALSLLEARLELPRGAAEALLLLGRSIGLMAHVAEETLALRHPRPRGCYVGPPPLEAPKNP